MIIQVLGAQSLGLLGPTNFLKHVIRLALDSGVSPETILLLFLLPLVAALVSAARYLVGIRGLGIFTPVMLAAVLWLTGINPGFYLFLIILATATLSRILLKRVRLHYLARMALLFWLVCVAVLVALFQFKFSLPAVLVLILITQDFIRVQIGKPWRMAMRLIGETILLGLGGWALLSWSFLQQLVLLQPEIMFLGTAVLNFLLGRFTGMRLLEYRRFRRLLK
jgi:hypothetical protein